MTKNHKCLKVIYYGILSVSIFIISAIVFYLLFFGNYTVEMADGTTHYYQVDGNNRDIAFEDSYVFENILIKQMEEITKMVVIKNQLETNGIYNPNKLIDIVEYSNRYNGNMLINDPVYYKLEDLLKWNRFGFNLLINTVEYMVPEEIYMDENGYYFNTSGNITDQYGTILQEQEIAKYKEETYTDNSESDVVEATTIENLENPEEQSLSEEENQEVDSSFEVAQAETVEESESLLRQPMESEQDPLSEQETTGDESNTSFAFNFYNKELQRIFEKIGKEDQLEWIEKYYYLILEEAFLPADGKTLLSRADNIAHYVKLKNYLIQAASDLSINYNTYMSFDDYYNQKNGVIRFLYCVNTEEGETFYFTNLDQFIKNKTNEEILEIFKSYGKYLYYNPDEMEYDTNMNVDSSYLESYLDNYEYTFGNHTKVFIAVDLERISSVTDVYSVAQKAYNSVYPYWWQMIAVIILAFSLYMASFIGLFVYEWKNHLKKADTIPVEFHLMIVLLLLIVMVSGYDAINMRYFFSEEVSTILLLAFISVVSNGIFLGILFSFIRRILHRSLLKYSICFYLLHKTFQFTYRIGKRVFLFVKTLSFKIYDNGILFIRTFFPYMFFLFINLLLITLFSLLGIFIAAVFDCFVFAFIFWQNTQRLKIVKGIRTIKEGNFSYQISTKKMHGDNLVLAEAVNEIGSGLKTAVENSMKDEKLKADLITNVSHDIKTPLTSIINYVDLIKREEIENEKIKGYIQILDSKSQRLKQLTDDLVEASKISSGNIVLEMEKINVVELIQQTLGEFQTKMDEKNLVVIADLPNEAVYIYADSRRMWRVIENLFNNICKYALENTRVYLDMKTIINQLNQNMIQLSIKNISAHQLNIDAEQLTERFIRGDVSRTTEGSGLGLSIAKNLTLAQGGEFKIYLDGDLFKVILEYPMYKA
jgi:signal transduction histidine kinase